MSRLESFDNVLNQIEEEAKTLGEVVQKSGEIKRLVLEHNTLIEKFAKIYETLEIIHGIIESSVKESKNHYTHLKVENKEALDRILSEIQSGLFDYKKENRESHERFLESNEENLENLKKNTNRLVSDLENVISGRLDNHKSQLLNAIESERFKIIEEFTTLYKKLREQAEDIHTKQSAELAEISQAIKKDLKSNRDLGMQLKKQIAIWVSVAIVSIPVITLVLIFMGRKFFL